MARHIPTEEQAEMILEKGWDHWREHMESRLSDGEMFVAHSEVSKLLNQQHMALLIRRDGDNLTDQERAQIEKQIKKHDLL